MSAENLAPDCAFVEATFDSGPYGGEIGIDIRKNGFRSRGKRVFTGSGTRAQHLKGADRDAAAMLTHELHDQLRRTCEIDRGRNAGAGEHGKGGFTARSERGVHVGVNEPRRNRFPAKIPGAIGGAGRNRQIDPGDLTAFNGDVNDLIDTIGGIDKVRLPEQEIVRHGPRLLRWLPR